MAGWLENNELDKMWKAVMASFEVTVQLLPGGSEEKNKKALLAQFLS
jgi:hypothetical protein